VALAAATLAGLLFVSLSIHPELIRHGARSVRLRLARQSFADLLYLLMLGLVFLVPHQSPLGLAVALIVLGLSRALGLLRMIVRAGRRSAGDVLLLEALREYGLPALASLGLLVIGIEVLRGNLTAIYAQVLVTAALLTSASWNAWILLVQEIEPPG
jgi:hypothetical protein